MVEKMKLFLVIPCYNEEEVINETASRLKIIMKNLMDKDKIKRDSRVLFVNDGSKDNTWNIIEEIASNNKLFAGIKLTRNKGHQNALLAGLMTAKDHADAVISLDADLQDDINAIEAMVDEYYLGNHIVYGVRNNRKKDTFFKKATAQGFYKFMKMLGVKIIYNHADYRLLSKEALECLKDFKEVNLFLRGMIPLIGYKSSIVYYSRNERFAGETKYPLKKMLSFAFDGITSFSIKPVRMITMLGVLILLASIIYFIYVLVAKFAGDTSTGWASIITSIWMLGGLQLLSIGIIGEYIGKIYYEAKARPRYFIEEVLLNDEEKID